MSLCLKKISEGCADWDRLWDKLEETDDPGQRDKIIIDMKRGGVGWRGGIGDWGWGGLEAWRR